MEWTSVKDKLPELYADVIVCRRGSAVESGRRINDGWWKVFGVRVKDVTHWQPLPDPPGIAMRAKDLVQVVRCKDCEYWAYKDLDQGICAMHSIGGWRRITPETAYCSMGVRKEDCNND